MPPGAGDDDEAVKRVMKELRTNVRSSAQSRLLPIADARARAAPDASAFARAGGDEALATTPVPALLGIAPHVVGHLFAPSPCTPTQGPSNALAAPECSPRAPATAASDGATDVPRAPSEASGLARLRIDLFEARTSADCLLYTSPSPRD